MVMIFISLMLIFNACCCNSQDQSGVKSVVREISVIIKKQYLNIPVSHAVDRGKMTVVINGHKESEFVIRLAPETPDYWVFYDVTPYFDKTLKITFDGNPGGLKKIYQDDKIAGQDSIYIESNRPRVHFTSRRGWNNDPNGLVYYEGEYHMFYQHNPFEREWENMSWGHAVSKDLIHWEELPVVMYPDEIGAIFSGTAVIDYDNTSGFGKEGIPPMIAAYTASGIDGQTQCIAWSLDRGFTFTKYHGNPVIDSRAKWKSRDLRDPDVFWYQPANHWVMVLFERDGNSIYTSQDLKKWNYESHTRGFWECPQLFELPVDGNRNNMKWIMYGASGTYMIGKFDGKNFTPESGKYYYGNGVLYAAQTFNNIPNSDGRCIQIGWGRIQQPGMPFNQMMLLPSELTLRTTRDGIRMFNNLIKEVDMLHDAESVWTDLDSKAATELLQQFNNVDAVRIRTTIELSHASDAGISLNGQQIFRYDMNFNQINGAFYSPENPVSMEISADIIIDRTSVEVFVDGGAFSYAIERKPDYTKMEGYKFFGNNIRVKSLKVNPLKSIWQNK